MTVETVETAFRRSDLIGEFLEYLVRIVEIEMKKDAYMAEQEKQFNNYIKAYLRDENDAKLLPTTDADWRVLFTNLCKHSMGSEVFSLIQKIPIERRPDAALYERWRLSVIKSVTIQLVLTEKGKDLITGLKNARIDYKVIKGMVTSICYPAPEYRLMSDLDLYLVGEDFNKAIRYLESIGYTTSDKKLWSPMHLTYADEDGFIIELHKKLHYSGFMRPFELTDWMRNIEVSQHLVQVGDQKIRCLSPEDALIHHILHLARHLAHQGATYRQLLDIIMVFREHQMNLNYEYINKVIKESGLKVFVNTLFSYLRDGLDIDVSEFDLEVPVVSHEVFSEFILGDLVIADYEDQYQFYSYMTSRFPFMMKMRIFKSLVYIGEILVNLRYHKMPLSRALKSAKVNMKNNASRVQLLKQLDLIN